MSEVELEKQHSLFQLCADFNLKAANSFLKTSDREQWVTRRPFGRGASEGSCIDYWLVSQALESDSHIASKFAGIDHLPIYLSINTSRATE